MAIYGAANLRLERDILLRFPTSVIDAARAIVADGGDGGVYLRPEEQPTWPT
jgi:hypothetical protein